MNPENPVNESKPMNNPPPNESDTAVPKFCDHCGLRLWSTRIIVPNSGTYHPSCAELLFHVRTPPAPSAATVTLPREVVEAVALTLQGAGNTFRRYESMHTERGKLDKAQANGNAAFQCETASRKLAPFLNPNQEGGGSGLVPMPAQFGTHPHDMAIGPCACGATHQLSDWPEEVQAILKTNQESEVKTCPSSVQPVAAPEWREMVDAPKDGSWIEGRDEGFVSHTVAFEAGEWKTRRGYIVRIFRWRPLAPPPAPTAQEAMEGEDEALREWKKPGDYPYTSVTKGFRAGYRAASARLATLPAERDALRKALEGIRDMPEYDQDDGHRLRDKAKEALAGHGEAK